jgi:hypothetical protein
VENGCCESFNSKLRDEFLNGEFFYSMKRVARGGRTLARPLQHRQTALVVRIEVTGARCIADRDFKGAWKSGKQKNASDFPTHSTAAASYLTYLPHYLNNLAGTKDRQAIRTDR